LAPDAAAAPPPFADPVVFGDPLALTDPEFVFGAPAVGALLPALATCVFTFGPFGP
jgi:hypothetical protein